MKAAAKKADPSERERFEVCVRERMLGLILNHYAAKVETLADMLLILEDAEHATAWVLTAAIPGQKA